MNVFLFMDPRFKPLDANGGIMVGSYLQFFDSETDAPTPVYADAALNTELGTQVNSEGDGTFPFMYMNPTVTYRIKFFDADDVLQWDVDPYTPPRDFAPGTVLEFFGTEEQRDAAYPPALWQLLDGSNGTPDARGRFTICVGGGIDVGDTGGSSPGTLTTTAAGAIAEGVTGDTVLTSDMVPAPALELYCWLSGGQGNAENFGTAHGVAGDNDHSYPGSYGYLDQTVDGNDLIRATGGGSDPHNHTVPAIPDHDHDLTTDLPPWVALWKIMRKYP